jgi:hypothetical protein
MKYNQRPLATTRLWERGYLSDQGPLQNQARFDLACDLDRPGACAPLLPSYFRTREILDPRVLIGI